MNQAMKSSSFTDTYVIMCHITPFTCKTRSVISRTALPIRHVTPFHYERYKLVFNYTLQHLATDAGKAYWSAAVWLKLSRASIYFAVTRAVNNNIFEFFV